jgi:hypothetical protein
MSCLQIMDMRIDMPSYYNRDSKSTKERSRIKNLLHAKCKTPKKDVHFQHIENTKVQCKNDKLIIPASLKHRAVSWYHHYLQHPSHSGLEETMRYMMYWKGTCNTIWSYIKSCRSCQINKRNSLKYGHVPPKLVIMTPW